MSHVLGRQIRHKLCYQIWVVKHCCCGRQAYGGACSGESLETMQVKESNEDVEQ